MKAFFLTAGEGTRLRPHTQALAKPSIPLLGVPLLHHLWQSLGPLNLSDLVVNLYHRPQDIMATAKNLVTPDRGPKLFFSDESNRLMDSGGGLNKAQTHFLHESAFLLANGDEVFFLDDELILKDFENTHRSSGALATLLVTDNPMVGTHFGGAFCSSDHQIKLFSKSLVPGLKGWHYVGIMLLRPGVFQYMKTSIEPENLLYHCLTQAIAAGELVQAFPAKMDWYEVGNEKAFLAITEILCEVLEKESKPWAQTLKNRIAWSYLEEPFVELVQPTLADRVRKLTREIKEGTL